MPDGDVNVSVQFTTVEYGIEAKTVGEGTITFTDGKTRFAAGTNVTATIKPNGTTYVLTKVMYDDGNRNNDITEAVNSNSGEYTFTMPAAHVKFEATFTAVGGEETQAFEARSAPLTVPLKRPPLPQWLSLPAPIRTAQALSSWMQL